MESPSTMSESDKAYKKLAQMLKDVSHQINEQYLSLAKRLKIQDNKIDKLCKDMK